MVLEAGRRNSFRVASSTLSDLHVPGLPQRNPGLKLANAFSVIRRHHFSHSLYRRWSDFISDFRNGRV